MAKLSEKDIAVTITGGYIHIILPDPASETGFTSYRVKLEDYLSGGGEWGTITGTLSNQTDLQTALNLKLPYLSIEETKGITGFIDNTNIAVSYNSTARTITLSGNLIYYWRGEKKELTSPWTSDPHDDSAGNWYLYSTDGESFEWSDSAWDFEDCMVALAYYQSTVKFALRETHGTMDYNAHDVLHRNVGTFRLSGGLLTAGTYTENTASDGATTPGLDQAVIQDEDCLTTIPAWLQGTYTTLYIGASNTPVFDIAASFPFIFTASNFLQVNNPTTGAMTAGINNRYYNIYPVLVPVSADSDSQKYRVWWLQPQATYTSLTAAQAEDVRGLKFGSLASSVPELVVFARITYVTSSGDSNSGKCRIATNGVTYVAGSRAGQINVTGFTTNAHDNLSDLGWTDSGHTGTANKIASFDSGGLASYTDDLFVLEVALSQLDADITAVAGVAKFPCPENMTLVDAFINVTTAPTGSSAIWDINVEGSSIMTNRIEIEVSELSSLDATTQPSFSDASVDRGEDITIDCDQTGSTIKPKNAVLVLRYRKR